MEAKKRGAKIIHVDPRFTRTSAMADLYVPIRSGSDIAFLGALINYVLSEEKYFREYVVHYTNAATILRDDFKDTDELDGYFSGWKKDDGKYDITSWQYEGVDDAVPAAGHKELFASPGAGHHEARGGDITDIERDETLTNPRCVFQVLKRHFARYTPEMVEEICGVPKHLFLQVARTITENSGRERTTAFAYAVGWTQHSVGVQYIRTASILQLLLGNIGRPGGGIMALRGHASIQGSTDIPTLFNLLPGYIPMPHEENGTDFQTWIDSNISLAGWWSELPKYAVSLLKAYYGEHATKDNDWGFDYLPRLTGNHSHMVSVADMADGKVRGYFVMGENPVVGSANGKLQREGLKKLDWLVVRDLVRIETAEFWRQDDDPPESIGTEVFFFPAAAHTEKDGSFTNTQRLLQWHHKAIDPPDDCRSELNFVYRLGKRLQELYRDSKEARDRGIQALSWDYPTSGKHEEPDAEAVLREINGYGLSDGKAVSGFKALKDDGSTVCGCWIYSGCYADETNQTAKRKPRTEQSWVAPDWGWAWPSNRRMMYNRASADPEGKPWSERKKYIEWSAAEKKWVGADVPDFIEDRPPDYRPEKGAKGTDTIAGDDPFIMQADGKAWLYAPSGLLDGPLPTHYEPQESPVENALYSQQCNPCRVEIPRKGNAYHRAYRDPRYPFVLTTCRLTEHHTAGGMSRWLGWLSELQPELFCEVSPELARERGLEHGGWATISSARGRIEARVLVTRRMRPLRIRGRTIHQIGIPYHFGSMGLVRGDSTNDLLSVVHDPNVNIPESKVLTGDIRPGRKSQQAPEKPVAVQDAARDRADVGHEHHRPTQMDSKS
jgi:formate dehydrogenase major subunit